LAHVTIDAPCSIVLDLFYFDEETAGIAIKPEGGIEWSLRHFSSH